MTEELTATDPRLLTKGEICGVIRRHLKKFPYHKGYPLRNIVANAQLAKVEKIKKDKCPELREKLKELELDFMEGSYDICVFKDGHTHLLPTGVDKIIALKEGK